MSKAVRVGALMMLVLSSTGLRAAPAPLFGCSFGASHVRVTSSGGKLVYRYGSSGKAALTIVEDPRKKNASRLHKMWVRSEFQGIRFVNGDYSYVVFEFFEAGPEGTDESGLAVFKGAKLVSHRMCKTGGGMSDVHALDGLSEDPLADDLIDRLKL